MLIRLEYNGRVVHEIVSSELKGEIIIGRSQSCEWQVPRDDQMCSSRHARLSVRGRQVWLHDMESTNGTFHNGKRISKRRLVAGDKIGVGNSVLSVEVQRAGGGRQLSALHVLTGKERGQRKQLKPPLFRIGSEPGSDLVFLDMLVSRRHAEISIKEDGSCWIRDLQSKNGTAVNGLPLRDDKERLLKDGDRVSFSHFEVEFQDGAVARSNKQVWLRLAILAATLAVGLGLYYSWQQARPSAEAYIREAQQLAAQESFDEAAEVVEKAATARRASSNQVAIENLRRQLDEWRNTLEVWQRAQRSLVGGRWVPASRDLGLLQASRKDAWEWNIRAMEERDSMSAAKALLDATLRGESLCGREEAGFQELEESLGLLKTALEQAPAESEILEKLLESGRSVVERLGGIVAESQAVEQALELLRGERPDYGEIVAAVEQRSASSEAAVKRRALLVMPALQAMAVVAGSFDAVREELRALNIKGALGGEVKLPPADLCAIEPRISEARQVLEREVREFRQQATQLQMLLAEVDKYGVVGGGPSHYCSLLRGISWSRHWRVMYWSVLCRSAAGLNLPVRLMRCWALMSSTRGWMPILSRRIRHFLVICHLYRQ